MYLLRFQSEVQVAYHRAKYGQRYHGPMFCMTGITRLHHGPQPTLTFIQGLLSGPFDVPPTMFTRCSSSYLREETCLHNVLSGLLVFLVPFQRNETCHRLYSLRAPCLPNKGRDVPPIIPISKGLDVPPIRLPRGSSSPSSDC